MTTLVRPGYGISKLHLRQSESAIVKVFGRPEGQQPSDGSRVYWLYPKDGVECLLSTRSHKLLSIFFRKSGKMSSDLQTDEGISFGSSKSEVVKAYGKPNLIGGGFGLSTGDYVDQWLSYKIGIGFHFGRDEQVSTISIFIRSKNRKHSAAPVNTD